MLPRSYIEYKGGHASLGMGDAIRIGGADSGTRGGTVGEHSYLIRYGVMSHVGRFSALPVRDTSLERGQLVVHPDGSGRGAGRSLDRR